MTQHLERAVCSFDCKRVLLAQECKRVFWSGVLYLLSREFKSKVERVQERVSVHVLLYFLLWGTFSRIRSIGTDEEGRGTVLSTKAEQSDTSGEGGKETKVVCGGVMFGRRKSDL